MQRRWIVFVVLAVVGCNKPAPAAAPVPSAPPAGPSPVVASFAGHRITTAEFQKYVDGQSSFVRSHYQDQKGKTAILEILIESQLLADQAAKAGYDHDDEVVEQLRKAMVTVWRRAKFNDGDGRRSLTAADLHAYYDSHRGQYLRPERARVQMVFFKADPAHEAAVQAEAEAARKTLSQSTDETAFGRLARTRSDDPTTRNKEGDLDARSHAELAKPYGEPVASAVESLKAPGELSPIVRGTGGFYLLRLVGRIPAEERSFETVEPELRVKLWQERRGPLWTAYFEKLKQEADIKVDDDQLSHLNSGAPTEGIPQPASPTPPTIEEQLRTAVPPFNETPADRAGPVVASFGGHEITANEMKRYFEQESPTFRANYQTDKAKRVLLDELIDSQLLVDQALQGGFQKDPLAQHAYQRSMIDVWMEEKVFKEEEGLKSFTEPELRAYYDAHPGDFHQPARVHLRMVFFKGDEKTVRSAAEEARRTLSGTKDRGAFSQLVQTRSDDPVSRAKGGDLDLRSHAELAKAYGESVAAAADALVLPGELSPVVAGTGGVYLLQLEGRAPAMDRSFEVSQVALRSILFSARKNQKVEEFLRDLMVKAQIQIDEAQLAKVEVKPGNTSDEVPEAARPAGAFGEEKLNTPLAEFHEFPYTNADLSKP